LDLPAHHSIIDHLDSQKYNLLKEKQEFQTIDITNCEPCKNILLVVENTISIRYYFKTAKTRALHESIDGPASRLADNPPNSDG